jgi:hypothetical protein
MQYFYQYIYTDGKYKGISQKYDDVKLGYKFQVLRFGENHRSRSEIIIKENLDILDMDKLKFSKDFALMLWDREN